MDLLGLPVVVIEKIFSYLSYDEIAKNRMVSRAFNDICVRLLNRGFVLVERRHALALKSVKAQLPRRESERRYHPLSRHCDILTSIETRISMLNMTYSKFIDSGLCCFIPGKVIDEMRRVLAVVEASSSPPRAHEVLQELRDISSMAIEHFDEQLSPGLRRRLARSAPRPAPAPAPPDAALAAARRQALLSAKLALYLAQQYKHFYKKMIDYKKVAWRQRKTIRSLMTRQREQNSAIAELRRRVEEVDIKYSELTRPAPQPTAAPEPVPLRHFGSQIKLDLSVLPIGAKRSQASMAPNMKPRKPLIKLPSLSEEEPAPPPAKQAKHAKHAKLEPSTSQRARGQAAIAKIRGIANEIKQLTSLCNLEGNLKRPLTLTDLNVEIQCKKHKLD